MYESVQREKAELCKKLGDLTMRIPPSVRNGSVQLVREWKENRQKAEKVLRNKASSANQLKSMYSLMEKYQ